jgi:hypothetical protein
MNNATCKIRLGENLGMMQDADYLKNRIGIRLWKTHYVAGGLHIEISTLAQQAELNHTYSHEKERFFNLFRVKASSTRPTVISTMQYLRYGRAGR